MNAGESTSVVEAPSRGTSSAGAGPASAAAPPKKLSRAQIEARLAALPGEMQPQAPPGVWPMVLEMAGEVSPAPRKVLNAGAGRGGMSILLRDLGFDVTNLDLHPDHFRADGMTCAFADFCEPLNVADNVFDLVIASEVIEHLENPWRFFREAVRVLRPGGQAILTSPNVSTLWSRLAFLRTGVLHYFREESFRGCYHVSPIFPWTIRRMCATTHAALAETRQSRVEWPRRDDVPRWTRRVRKALLRAFPRTPLFGEITGYRIVKTADAARVGVGTHYA